MADTEIEWTERVWNPVTGCDRVGSPGCDHCYALAMARRLKAMGQPKYQRDGDPKTSGPGFGVTEHMDALALPLRWRKPAKVFVNSMSDLFHKDVSDDFIARAFAVVALTPHLTFQLLTKRHARMRSLLSDDGFAGSVDCLAGGIAHDNGMACPDEIPWPLPNLWLGVSCETQQWADIRIPALLRTPAAVRWVSAEPLLGPLSIGQWLGYPRGVDWVVSGGESGPGARPAPAGWHGMLRDQCEAAGVPYLFKQHGEYTPYARTGDSWLGRDPDVWVDTTTGQAVSRDDDPALCSGSWAGMWRVGKKAAGRLLDGRTHDEYPTTTTMEGTAR